MIESTRPLFSLSVAEFLELQRSERRRPEPPQKELPKYLTPVDLANLCKWKLSTVYQNHHNGLIPGAKKVGNKLLFDTEIVLAWIEAGSFPTKGERLTALREKAFSK